MTPTARLAVAAGVVLLAACSRDGLDPTNLTPQFDRDIALFAADAAGQDVEVMRGPGGKFGMGLLAHPGSFECDDVEHDGLTLTRTCTFYDASGAVQTEYDPESTASVVIHAELSGSVDRMEWSATVDRVRDVEITGLAGDETELVWNGTGSGTMSRIRQSSDGGEMQMSMSSTETATNVTVPVPRTEDGWPLSGTITKTVTMTVTGGPRDGTTHSRDVTITFDGSQYAEVTLNGETFTVDLAERRHVGRHHHHPPPPR